MTTDLPRRMRAAAKASRELVSKNKPQPKVVKMGIQEKAEYFLAIQQGEKYHPDMWLWVKDISAALLLALDAVEAASHCDSGCTEPVSTSFAGLGNASTMEPCNVCGGCKLGIALAAFDAGARE